MKTLPHGIAEEPMITLVLIVGRCQLMQLECGLQGIVIILRDINCLQEVRT